MLTALKLLSSIRGMTGRIVRMSHGCSFAALSNEEVIIEPLDADCMLVRVRDVYAEQTHVDNIRVRTL